MSNSSSFGRRKSAHDPQERELLQGQESSSSEEPDRPHKPKACERVNSLARTAVERCAAHRQVAFALAFRQLPN